MNSLQKKKWTALLTLVLIIILTAGSLGFFLVKADDGTEGIPDFNLLAPDAKGVSISEPDNSPGIFDSLMVTDLKLALDTKKISMGISCQLSDDIRENFMTTIPGLEDFIADNCGAPDYEALLGDFLTAQGINPLSFTLQISIKGSDPADTGAIWDIIAGASEGMIESKQDSGPGQVIGSYRLEKTDTHILSVTAVLDWCAYDAPNYGSLYAGFNFSLDYTDTALSDTSFMEAAWGEHMLDLTVHTDSSSGGSTEDTPSYSISKEMSGIEDKSTTEQTSIPFKITAQAGGSGCLNGKTILDSLDSYLTIRSVKLSVDGGPDVDLSPGDYTYENNVFSYTMEALDGTGPDDSSNVIKDALITIVTELSDKGTEDLMKDNSLNHTVKNKAQLMEDETVLGESSETNAVIKTQFFNKTGKAYGYTGNQFQWEIKVNSAFSHPVKSYVIDKINLSAHSYAASEGVTIASGNGASASLGITTLTDNTTGNLKSYSELTSSNEESYHYAEAIIDQASGNCAYYRQDGDTGILIIPISGYSRDTVTIKYITEAKKTAVSDKVEMHNSAKAVWRWDLNGSGPYPFVPSGDIEVQKDIATDYSLIKKAADNYDSKTQLLTWTATINQYGLEMADGAVITDTIDPSEQIFAGIIGENKPIPVTAYNRTTTNEDSSKSFTILHKDEAGSSLNFYEVVRDSAGMDCFAITIGKKIDAEDYYTLTFQTKVVDSRQLASQHDKNGYTAKNTMKLTVTGSPGISDESTETIHLPNTLITKEAVNPLYDVNTYESGWKTTVNPNYYPIKDGVVTDTLPSGSTFGKLTSVTMVQKDSLSPVEGVIDASGRSVSFDGGTRMELEILPDLTPDNRQQLQAGAA